MDNQVSSSASKMLASFETVYKENVLSKPQNIKVFVTEDGIYGTAFICDQIGTKEDDMFYSSFECSFDIITKVYINFNNKLQPVYVQCADSSTGVMNQRRIILPGFNNNNEIIKAIEDGKEKFDNRPEKQAAAVDNQAAIYSEKKLAYFETVYRENMLSKPQDINITVTPQHVYGKGFICLRTGINEEDPVYKGFTCSFDEITKIYINNSNKIAPIYIQCGDDNTNGKTSRRIILPKFEEKDKEKIVQAVNDAKAEFESKLEQQRDLENERKLKELEARRRAQDDEFESMTSGYKDMIKSEVKQGSAPKSAPVSASAPKPAPAPASTPKPAPAPASEPKPAPAPAPTPKPAPAPAPAPKPAPAPAPAPKPTHAPVSVPKPAPAPAPIPESAPTKNSVTVEDILGLDDILGIRADDMSSVTSFMDEISDEPDEEEINSMPEETIQKNPDKIEELTVPVTDKEYEPKEVHEEKVHFEIEELDPSKEIAKKLTSKPVVAPEAAPAPEPAEEPVQKEEAVSTAEPLKEISAAVSGENMSLEDFETAVKKLKSMLDNGVISESEFAVEKKKLFKLLY